MRLRRLVSAVLFSILLLLTLFGSLILEIETSESEPSTYALSFDGTNDYVSVAHSSTLNFSTGDFSICLWVKLENITADYQSFVVKHNIDWTPETYWWLYHTISGDEVLWETGDGLIVAPNSNLDDGDWHFIVGLRGEGTMKLYLDDEFIVDGAFLNSTETVDSTGILSIGGDPLDNDYYVNGTFDEIAIYNRGLTESEITYAYNNGLGRYAPLNTTGLVAWYKFEEGSGSDLYDRSGNNNHGTLSGATWASGETPDWYSIDQFYIQTDYNTSLSSPSYSEESLTFTLSASSGVTSTTKVYCGSKGEPTTVTGATSWTYDGPSTICTITVTHSSSETITLDWSEEETTQYEETKTHVLSYGYIGMGLASLAFIVTLAVGIISLTSGQPITGKKQYSTEDLAYLTVWAFAAFVAIFVITIVIGSFTNI